MMDRDRGPEHRGTASEATPDSPQYRRFITCDFKDLSLQFSIEIVFVFLSPFSRLHAMLSLSHVLPRHMDGRGINLNYSRRTCFWGLCRPLAQRRDQFSVNSPTSKGRERKISKTKRTIPCLKNYSHITQISGRGSSNPSAPPPSKPAFCFPGALGIPLCCAATVRSCVRSGGVLQCCWSRVSRVWPG